MKIFYGWKMVGAAATLQFLQSMMWYQAFGAYAAILMEDKGWSKTAVAGGAALQSMEGAIIGPVLGVFLDKFGSRGVIRIGTIMFGVGLMVFSQVDTIPAFYCTMVIMMFGCSMAGYFPLNVGVIQWFERKRARALSMVSLGLGFGGMSVPLVALCIDYFGWRWTAFGCGVLAIAIGYPMACIFRRRPEDFGEVVDGGPPKTDEPERSGKGAPAQASVDFTPSEAFHTRAFWLIAGGHALALVVVSAVNAHAINHMRISLGYTIAHAATVITVMTMFQVFGVLIGGYIGDKVDKRFVAAGCMWSHAIGLLMLTYATGMGALLAFAVLHGLAWGVRGPFMQAIRADYFGRTFIGSILGISAIIAAAGQIFGPLLAGVLGDATGNYKLGFTVLAVIAACGSVLFLAAKRPPPPVRLRPPTSAPA